MDAQVEANGSTIDGARATRQRRVRRVMLALLVVALIVGGIWYVRHLSYGQFQQETNNAFIQADNVTVSPKIAGYVERVLVRDNQVVAAGDPLIVVDARSYRAQADQSQAQVRVAEASLAAFNAQVGEQRAAIERAEADARSAQAQVMLAKAQVDRYTPLVAAGVETRAQLDQFRGQLDEARGRLTSADASVTSARRRVATLEAQGAQARAQGQAARAQLASVNTDVGGAVIRASVAGRVGNSSVRPGQYVQAGTRLMSIVPAGRLYIEANFKETQVGLMRVGQPVEVRVDALPDIAIAGRVDSISPATGAQFSVLPPQNATGNFTKVVQRVPVRISMALSPAVRARIAAGMSAEVVVDTRSARNEASSLREAQERVNARAGR